MRAISRPSNCSRGDAVHLLGGYLCQEVPRLRGARGPDMHSEVSGPGKTCEMSPDRWCSLTQLYNFSCGTRCRPLTLSQSVSLAPSPVSSLFRFYQFFQPNFFPLHLSTSPHRIHHRTLTSICCLPSISRLVIVFLLGLAGLHSQMVCCLLTNVSGSLASITGVAGWSRAALNETPKATI